MASWPVLLIALLAAMQRDVRRATSRATSRAPGHALRVPGPVYTLRPTGDLGGALLGVAVPYRYANPRHRAAAVWGCYSPDPPRLERWDGRRWTVVYVPIVRRCGAEPAFIPAGATREDEVRLTAGPDSLLSRVSPLLPASLLPGRFRLVRDITDSVLSTHGAAPLDRLRPRAERTSNAFELRAAPGGAP